MLRSAVLSLGIAGRNTIGSRYGRWSLIPIVVALALVFAWLNVPSIAQAEQTDNRYVVLIQGLTSEGVQDCLSSAEDEFSRWRAVVRDELGLNEDKILSVSYSGNYCDGEEFSPFV